MWSRHMMRHGCFWRYWPESASSGPGPGQGPRAAGSVAPGAAWARCWGHEAAHLICTCTSCCGPVRVSSCRGPCPSRSSGPCYAPVRVGPLRSPNAFPGCRASPCSALHHWSRSASLQQQGHWSIGRAAPDHWSSPGQGSRAARCSALLCITRKPPVVPSSGNSHGAAPRCRDAP